MSDAFTDVAKMKKIKEEKQEKMEDYGGFGEHKHFDDIDE